MLKQVDYTKCYAAHYIQLGSSYACRGMLSFDEEGKPRLSSFDREYPSTIFISGTILIYPKGKDAVNLERLNKVSIDELQGLLNINPKNWSIKLP